MSAVTFIGFGEAAQAFSSDERWRGQACAYDRLTDDDASRAAKEGDYASFGVSGRASLELALADAPLILSLVTADQALDVASAAALHISPNAIFCDMNSVAPGTKAAASARFRGAGAAYVDVAIMAPVRPGRLDVPLLVSGPEATLALESLEAVGFSNVRAVGERVGQASAIKMIRSVIVKGIEALSAEAMLAAHAAEVTDEVLASLDSSDKAMKWCARADYNLERMMVHGVRRAEEMREAAKTLVDLGVEPAMTIGTIRRQEELGELGLKSPPEGLCAKIQLMKTTKAGTQ